MEPVSCIFVVDVNSLLAGNTVSDSMNEFVGKQFERCYGEDKDRIAGFVLTLGYHHDILGKGYQIARRINDTIVEIMPETFGGVRSEAFGAYRKDTPEGQIWVRVYFVTGINNSNP